MKLHAAGCYTFILMFGMILLQVAAVHGPTGPNQDAISIFLQQFAMWQHCHNPNFVLRLNSFYPSREIVSPRSRGPKNVLKTKLDVRWIRVFAERETRYDVIIRE